MIKQLLSLFITLSALVYPASALDGDTFTVNCQILTVQRSDPILNPGVASGHVHTIIGGNAFRRTMIGKDATLATATTCDKSIDHSNYWVPQLYHIGADKKLELVSASHAAIYYQKRACDYSATARSCDKSFVPLAFPDGFRMIAGNPFRRTQNDSDFAQKAINMMCIFTGGSIQYQGFPPRQCNTIRAEVYFPSCWNGKDVDTADHMSHMSYPAIGNYNGGVCPQSHPVALFSIFYEFFFDTNTFTDIDKYVFANGDPTGYGYHGDFVMGWTDRDALQHAHENCINAADCPTLGNKPQTKEKLIYPAIYEEEIGLNGTISSLPGNNPITYTTEQALYAKSHLKFNLV